MKPCPLLLASAFLLAGVPVGYATLHAHEPAAPAPAATAAENYDIDGVHSQVVFKVSHMGVSNNYGRFNDISGKFAWDAADPSKSSIEITIKADSVDTGAKDRDNHLRGPEFFDAKQFPNMSFKSTKVEKSGEHGLKITGDMTLHGKTNPVTLNATLVGSKDSRMGYRTGFEASFSIKRSDYGMGQMLDMLGDEISVLVNVEGVRK